MRAGFNEVEAEQLVRIIEARVRRDVPSGLREDVRQDVCLRFVPLMEHMSLRRLSRFVPNAVRWAAADCKSGESRFPGTLPSL